MYQFQDPQEKVAAHLMELGLPQTHDDMEYIEHRMYHDYVGTVDHDLRDPGMDDADRSWQPYEQDLSKYPEVFKKYQENYARYDKVKQRFENEDPLEDPGESPFARKLPKDMTPWEKKYDTMMPRYTGTSPQ